MTVCAYVKHFFRFADNVYVNVITHKYTSNADWLRAARLGRKLAGFPDGVPFVDEKWATEEEPDGTVLEPMVPNAQPKPREENPNSWHWEHGPEGRWVIAKVGVLPCDPRQWVGSRDYQRFLPRLSRHWGSFVMPAAVPPVAGERPTTVKTTGLQVATDRTRYLSGNTIGGISTGMRG